MNVLEYVNSHVTLLDGGMGTLLQKRGLRPGEYPERWNITHPHIIIEIQKAYFDAGSNIVSTSTFGANGLKFGHDELEAIIQHAVSNTKMARDNSTGTQEKFIALNMGPCGKLLKPYGDLEFEEAVALFSEIVKIGVKCGVDLIYLETMNDSYETKAALLAAKENSDLPVMVSNAFGEDGKLMTGADAKAMIAMLEGMGADIIGLNCSFGPKTLKKVAQDYLKYASVPVMFKPNAGLPRVKNGETVYDVLPDEFADDVAELVREGVRLCGGCCGTTPEYIETLSNAVKDIPIVEITEKNRTLVSSYTHAVEFDEEPILIGERINPTGKKRFKQALIDNDIDYILKEGVNQQERGVQILDVNVGIPDIDESEMLGRATFELQSIINLPLQIDTAKAEAMETALRLYNGKAMINSVNGKEESMNAVFPLVKKYGGVVVALTLDEDGIPATAEGRVAIARKIMDRAAEYGIKKKDIIFDTLAMTVSADNYAALATLKALDIIKNEMGCHTSLGVSNISFGLPERSAINSTFFAIALERGLSAAIMNPYSAEMMQVYYAFKALHGMDEACAKYIHFMVEEMPNYQVSKAMATAAATVDNPEAKKNDKKASIGNELSELQRSIIKGLKEESANQTAMLLKDMEPLDIVQNEIIPALDIVGVGYEKKTVYLPQLLMSAEAAKAGFEKIKEHIEGHKSVNEKVSTEKCTCIVATVEGDIHDIGKNIVKLILENYGFKVTDLGKDVPVETIVEEVVATKAPICGLSALMTTTVPAMEKTIKRLHEAAPWCHVVVGGAVLNKEYAESIKADWYAKDAMETVRYAESINNKDK